MPSTNKPENLPVPDAIQPAPATEGPDPEVIEALYKKLAALQKVEEELKAQVEKAKPALPKESTPLPEDRLASEATEAEVARMEILRDPYDSRGALKILKNPPGKVLRWLSTLYRETRTMRGWQAVRYDDAIGREAERYIGVVPVRMEGNSKLDAVIRRGDVFLAWIDYGIWKARQDRREDEAARRIGRHRTKLQEAYGPHGSTTDAGLQRDANPYSELRKAPHFVMPDDYRKQAKGTHEDPVIKVKGQSMFEEAPEEE